jgi:hypothetical protein
VVNGWSISGRVPPFDRKIDHSQPDHGRKEVLKISESAFCRIWSFARPCRVAPAEGKQYHQRRDDGGKTQRNREHHPIVNEPIILLLHLAGQKNEPLAVSSACGDVLLSGFFSLCSGVSPKFSRRIPTADATASNCAFGLYLNLLPVAAPP